MILVGLESGSQRVFGSPHELADAIRGGELSPRCRIYHRASAQWLPITAHPEFQKVEAEQNSAAERWDRPLPPLARTQWTFFGMESRERFGELSEGDSVAGAHSTPRDSASEPPAAPAWRRALGRAMGYIRSRRSS